MKFNQPTVSKLAVYDTITNEHKLFGPRWCDQHSWKRRKFVFAVVLLIFSMVAVSTAVGFDEQSLTAPVRKIVVAEPDPSMQMVPIFARGAASGGSGSLRYLSINYISATSVRRWMRAHHDFVLCCSGFAEGPMVIEAEIQIDGQPYQMA
ncbi:MAG: hypothetical protein U0936_23620 [Planctomycetaceae bacterium]